MDYKDLIMKLLANADENQVRHIYFFMKSYLS